MNYDELMNSFKNLNDDEKREAIMEFIEKNINAIRTINKNIGNNKNNYVKDIDNDSELDDIYELLLIMTDEINSFATYVEDKFYE